MRYDPPMASPRSKVDSRMRSARAALLWLALALVLAIAQTIAIRHAYSHAPGESSSPSSQGKHAGGLAHCQSCVVAASMGGGAPPGAVLLLAVAATQQLAIFTVAADHSGPHERPYAIRAPPALAS